MKVDALPEGIVGNIASSEQLLIVLKEPFLYAVHSLYYQAGYSIRDVCMHEHLQNTLVTAQYIYLCVNGIHVC